jgi:hypothetical protein
MDLYLWWAVIGLAIAVASILFSLFVREFRRATPILVVPKYLVRMEPLVMKAVQQSTTPSPQSPKVEKPTLPEGAYVEA